jgi:hypothetical protein
MAQLRGWLFSPYAVELLLPSRAWVGELTLPGKVGDSSNGEPTRQVG